MKKKILITIPVLLILFSVLLAQTGRPVRLWDTNSSNLMTLKWNENDTSDRTFNIKVNAGNRTIDLSGDLTVESASLINQDLTTDATAVQFASLGIGTTTIPHGGVGVAKFAIDGPNAAIAGPYFQITTDSNDFPLFGLYPFAHDNVVVYFDAYVKSDLSGAESSDAGSSFAIMKGGDAGADLFAIMYDVAAAGAAITWNPGIVLNTSGQVMVYGDLIIDADNKVLYVGVGQDGQFYHDGTDTILTNRVTGKLILKNIVNADMDFHTNNTLVFSLSNTGVATFTQNSDTLTITGDGNNFTITQSDGVIQFINDEGNNDNYITIQGSGSGFGALQVYDENQDEWMQIHMEGGDGFIALAGSAPDDLTITVGDSLYFSGIPTTDAGDYDLRYDAADGVVYDTSDSRQKSDIKPLDYGLNEIMQLRPKRYFYNQAKVGVNEFIITEKGNHTIGLLAQDVYSIIPEATYKPEDESKHLWGLNEDKLTPVIINAIQEQQFHIEALEARIAQLESLILRNNK